jgi:hypothetical protein
MQARELDVLPKNERPLGKVLKENRSTASGDFGILLETHEAGKPIPTSTRHGHPPKPCMGA